MPQHQYLTWSLSRKLNVSLTLKTLYWPVGGISSGAPTATGIPKRNNQLFLRNRPVECKDANTALASFADWIDRQGKKVVLVGHNVERFDMKHFWRWISVHNLVERFENLGGFIDTLPLLRS